MNNNHDAEAFTPPPANALPKGTRLHEYEITAVIGDGGFGIVYLATDTLLGRKVAIKEYLPASHAVRRENHRVEARTPDQQDLFDKGLKSFVAEARILAQFRSPNLVEVLRFWEGNGTAYMVMPYYEGRTVRDLLQKGFRATEKASLFNILLPLLQGLEHVHKAGCFHRDISPDNIVILPDGSPLLLDFGAARHEIINQAESTTVILKPGFAPIEQYGGKETAEQQGAWTDIYALCAVAYQLITGHVPPVSVARIIRDPLTPLTVTQTTGWRLPGTVLKAIDAGLQVHPQERPQSIEAFRELLLAEEDIAVSASDDERVHQQRLTDEVIPVNPVIAASPVSDVKTALVAPTEVSTQRQMQERFKWKGGIGALAGLIVLSLAVLFFARNSETVDTAKTAPAVDSQQAHEAGASAPVILMGPVITDSEAVSGAVDLPSGGLSSSAERQIQAGLEERPALGSTGSNAVDAVPTAMGIDPSADKTTAGTTGNADGSAHDAVEPLSDVPQSHAAGASDGDTDAMQSQEDSVLAGSAPATGFVVVQARPWSDVYLNGELLGTTPPSLRFEVSVGENTIELRNDSAQPYVQTITVEGGKTLRIDHEFIPVEPVITDSGTVPGAVDSSPGGLSSTQVSPEERPAQGSTGSSNIDEASAGTGNADGNTRILEPLSDTPQSQAAGANDGDADTIQPQEDSVLTGSAPATGFVVVQARPWSDVYLNGELVGTTPPSLRFEAPVGENIIELRNDSAQPHVQTVTVRKGRTVRIGHEFTP